MTEKELRVEFQRREPALAAWGSYVTNTIYQRLREELERDPADKRRAEDFLKIPAVPRVKKIESFLNKALHRGKPYQNPIEDITDAVGVRFVVLLSTETRIISNIVKASGEWEARQDRAFEQDRMLKPHYFEYESDHFIVRNLVSRSLSGTIVPAGIVCEVQVRTLLQHAYAELSHDRVYKPECKVPDEVRRQIARGSALLETTDNVFCQVSDSIQNALQKITDAHNAAVAVCQEKDIPLGAETPQVTFKLLEHYPDQIAEMNKRAFTELVARRDYIPAKMKAHASDSVLFRHPSGLISYWLTDRLESGVKRSWPFSGDTIETIAADLGVSLDT